MAINENKIKHILSVARLMYELSISDGNDEEFSREMFTLGYLHDIGYEFCNKPSEHPEVGEIMLDSYKYKKEILYHGKLKVDYSSYALDLLNKADLLISNTGEYVGAEKRIEYIKENYGDSSPQYNNAKILAEKLKLL